MSARRAEAARPRGYAARIARVAAAFAIGIVSAGGVAHADCIDDAARRYGVKCRSAAFDRVLRVGAESARAAS
ncbi:hypothetical protein Y047_5685 [Burkholderia pseudomallei MSHR3016]|nr:hypothetical protein Y047_5685 [Burkholderia pseudomallei MSHR3016]